MRMDNMKKGLEILIPLSEANLNMCAEHDQIWLGGPDPSLMHSDEAKALEELGFFWDESVDSWSCYT